MSESDEIFNNLRKKLDIMGYTEMLPLTGVPLVGALFQDLVKTTESLRDAKRELIELMETDNRGCDGVHDCCKEKSNMLIEENNKLRFDKMESLSQIRGYQEKMHEAMKRAMNMELANKDLERELEDLKNTALQVESQANEEIHKRDKQIEEMQMEIVKLSSTKEQKEVKTARKEQKLENERLQKKIYKLKSKISCMQQTLHDKGETRQDNTGCDEDKDRLKAERDFFQKEYLNLVGKTEGKMDVEFLQNLIKSKDEELRNLRSEILHRVDRDPHPSELLFACPSHRSQSARHDICSNVSAGIPSAQAAVLRAERERDCLREELHRVCSERDALRERDACLKNLQSDTVQKLNRELEEYRRRMNEMADENRRLISERVQNDTRIACLKEEIQDLQRRLSTIQQEYSSRQISHNNLKILYEQNERSLVECQSKLDAAERKLKANDECLINANTYGEESHREISELRIKVKKLTETYETLEKEKDDLLQELDKKTIFANKLENELSSYKDKCAKTEEELQCLEKQIRQRSLEKAKGDEIGSAEELLRKQLSNYKANIEELTVENERLSKHFADNSAEIMMLKKRLKSSELEINRLKCQLSQYVQKVKEAEDLLMYKENEREEMLDYYRCLSHDAVILESNNQSLEEEAAESKRKMCELEGEVKTLKGELAHCNAVIEQLEDRVSDLLSKNSCLEHQIEEAIGEQRLLRIDLNARKELCDKLDIQKDKLNAELNELNEIRRKLEKDNEKLRTEFQESACGDKVSTQTLEELLAKTRHDLEQQMKVDGELSREILRLREQNDEILNELNVERQKRLKQETLTHEYQVQNSELRHNLTDDRFRQARTREQSSSTSGSLQRTL